MVEQNGKFFSSIGHARGGMYNSNPVNLMHLVRNTRAADRDHFYVGRY